MTESRLPSMRTYSARGSTCQWLKCRSLFRALLMMLACALLAAPSPVRGWQGAESETVLITMEQFGLAGHWRPGTMTPVRLALNYSGTKPVQGAQVVLEQPDADGDIQEISQITALNAGRNFVTLYVPVSYGATQSTVWDVVVYAYENDRRGSELAAARFTAQGAPRELHTSIIGIVGTRTANLSEYVQINAQGLAPASGHEVIQILSDIRAENLPERWMGLELLDTLVWTQGDPVELTIDQAEAIENWVERGGHFIIVLPQVGDSWQSTRLDAIMPDVIVRRVEGIELRDNATSGGLLALISGQEALEPAQREPFYPVFNLNVFEPVGARWSDSSSIPFMEIELPDLTSQQAARLAVVVQRNIGHGRVTLIGIPVIDPTLNRPGLGLPDAEIFWNQILGYRRDLPTPTEVDTALRSGNSPAFGGRISRFRAPLSDRIPTMIQLSATASRGLLLAVIVFIVFWLVSGPGLFAFLAARKASQHNWLAFVGITAIFTGISWAGATWLRSSEIRPIHVTILDHIANENRQRSTSYITVALNGYTERRVSADPYDDDGPGDESADSILRVLTAPDEQIVSFPDVRRYTIASSEQNAFGIPARSTSKSLYVSSLHPIGDAWKMPTFATDDQRPQVSDDGLLTGVLTHQLPGVLEDVTIYYVSNRLAASSARNSLQAKGLTRLRIHAEKIAGDRWGPGVPLDLSSISTGYGFDVSNIATSRNGQLNTISQDAAAPHRNLARQNLTMRQKRRSLEALTFFRALEPPPWDGRGASNAEEPQFLRSMAREIDLSEWLTRPCIIITGFLSRSPVPYSLSIDGEPVKEADPGSMTMVRWIYPLPVETAPQVFQATTEQDAEPAPTGDN